MHFIASDESPIMLRLAKSLLSKEYHEPKHRTEKPEQAPAD